MCQPEGSADQQESVSFSNISTPGSVGYSRLSVAPVLDQTRNGFAKVSWDEDINLCQNKVNECLVSLFLSYFTLNQPHPSAACHSCSCLEFTNGLHSKWLTNPSPSLDLALKCQLAVPMKSLTAVPVMSCCTELNLYQLSTTRGCFSNKGNVDLSQLKPTPCKEQCVPYLADVWCGLGQRPASGKSFLDSLS